MSTETGTINPTPRRENTLRRIIGFTLLAIGALGIILSLAGLIVGVNLIDGLGTTVDDALSLTSNSLVTTRDTLVQTKTSVQDVTASLGHLETIIVEASETVDQSDALLDQLFQIVSQDVPDALDQGNTLIPPAAETTQSFLGNVETTLAHAGETVDQTAPIVNQILIIASQDVPDTIDAMHATVPAAADTTQTLLGDVEKSMVDASITVDLTDQTLDQIIGIASQDIPDSIDAVRVIIPESAETTQRFLTNVETTLVDTSKTVDTTEAALDQTLMIAGRDVPDTLDQVSATISPVAETTQLLLGDLETTLGATRQTVQQTDAALVEVSQLVSQDVPETLDQLNDMTPTILRTTEQNVNTTLALLQELDYLDRTYRVRMDEPTAQLTGNLEQLSGQLRALDSAFETNLSDVDQTILTVSEDVAAINGQIDELLVTVELVQDVSDQFRSLESFSDNNLDTVSQDMLVLSNDVAAINEQIDELVVTLETLEDVSTQLRALETVSDNNLQTISRNLLTLSKNIPRINDQIDQFVVAADSLQDVSSQLRELEPYADIDLNAISQDMFALSEDVAAINGQIDQVVAFSSSLQDISDQLRGLESYGDTNLTTVSRDISTLSEDVATINTRVGEFNGLVDQYIVLIDTLNSRVSQTQANLDQQLVLAKTGLGVLMIWVLLAQVTPLYLGWELVTGRRDGPVDSMTRTDSKPEPEPGSETETGTEEESDAGSKE